jgi:Protein of unknown function (DUF2721)
MDMPTDTVADVARAIQLALAPVFLLTGISGLLNVMTNRLARIVDRARALKEKPGITISAQETLAMRLRRLERRRHFTSIAITSCTIAALLLCLVVATLFFEAMSEVRLSWFVGIQFMGSTLALVVGLGNFLREVHLATQMRIEMPDTK